MTRLRRLAWRARRLPSELIETHVRAHHVSSAIRHIGGPAQIDYAPDELLVICTVRNGATHVHSFIEHHLALGVRHIVLLDNGSSDDTIDHARMHDHVTILQTDLPYALYENVFKRHLAKRFSTGRWNLCVDIDERFDYPASTRLTLSGLLRYLDHYGYTAMVSQMLDMLPSMDGLPRAQSSHVTESWSYYDTSAIRRTPYEWGTVSDDRVCMHWGGVRHTLFGTWNGLTKAALVRVDPGTRLFVDWHHVGKGRIADVTGLLLHYPFVGSFEERVREAVASGRYGYRTTDEYRAYLRTLRNEQGLPPHPASARRFTNVGALVDEGFLVASASYREWVSRSSGEEIELA